MGLMSQANFIQKYIVSAITYCIVMLSADHQVRAATAYSEHVTSSEEYLLPRYLGTLSLIIHDSKYLL